MHRRHPRRGHPARLGAFQQREALFQQLLAQEYAKGSAMNMAATLEIDAVIDPADTRDWVQKGLQGQPAVRPPGGLMVDAW
jgi:acetyl-CoA carboxylase carboxyltransferase component